ncbi:RNA methyltransferase, TrmH family [Sanguibacter gelidistatuariae]|uniref:RNA methyltransferase, TrmH family n=1 Tax=Sanguibacter gelidistatuariae TaxID=1814289 RepID=A0A1G6P247_9MICO|nr:RNA methyltransferase [Sanguibacter gelidistatuariae]SDC74021.1 RNA methyltransferase, TrmH family [Sanguibacter gelidistatuariae]
MTELTNVRSERVKVTRSLAGRSARSRAGRFLVEGPQGVREAVRFAPGQVRDIYFTRDSYERYTEIVVESELAGMVTHVASEEVLNLMSPDAQGVLAVLDLPAAQDPAQHLEVLLDAGPRLVAVLSNVRDPGNAGAVIRAADAAGADLVVLTSESVDIHSPKVVRSTAGSLFHLPVVTGLPLTEIVAALSRRGLTTLAADGVGTHDLDDLLDTAGSATDGVPDLSQPSAWIFGNEAWGLREEERALADAVVRVPIRGKAESLNLATAATVCLYASSRAQR